MLETMPKWIFNGKNYRRVSIWLTSYERLHHSWHLSSVQCTICKMSSNVISVPMANNALVGGRTEKTILIWSQFCMCVTSTIRYGKVFSLNSFYSPPRNSNLVNFMIAFFPLGTRMKINILLFETTEKGYFMFSLNIITITWNFMLRDFRDSGYNILSKWIHGLTGFLSA